MHRRHCYTYYQDLLRKRELKHYITITLRCVLKRKRTKTIFLKILFFLSQGYLEHSFLFYGYYGNEYIHVGAVKYPLPLAYFVVFMGTYLFSIIIVLRA